MPRGGSKPGERRGGRKLGTPNKNSTRVAEICNRLKCDPVELMVKICKGDLPCGVCHGAGRSPFQPARGESIGVRTCESCYGSGKERIGPRERQAAASDLMGFIYPKLKAIELTGADGEALDMKMVVEFVRPS